MDVSCFYFDRCRHGWALVLLNGDNQYRFGCSFKVKHGHGCLGVAMSPDRLNPIRGLGRVSRAYRDSCMPFFYFARLRAAQNSELTQNAILTRYNAHCAFFAAVGVIVAGGASKCGKTHCGALKTHCNTTTRPAKPTDDATCVLLYSRDRARGFSPLSSLCLPFINNAYRAYRLQRSLRTRTGAHTHTRTRTPAGTLLVDSPAGPFADSCTPTSKGATQFDLDLKNVSIANKGCG